jgi:hypothetical protein
MILHDVYNLLFKSCRAAPQRLRKTEKSTVDPPIIHLYYLCSHWFISKSIVNCLYLYFQYFFSLACGPPFPSFLYIVDIRLFICCLIFNTGNTRLDDLFFCNLVYTLVNGLSDIFFVFPFICCEVLPY